MDVHADLRLPKAGGTVTENLDMQRNKIVNLPNPSSGGEPATKNHVDQNSGGGVGNADIDLQNKYNALNSKQRTSQELKIHYTSLISWEEAAENFVGRTETFPINTAVDLNNMRLYHVPNPTL